MRANKKSPLKSDKTQSIRGHKRGVVGYSRKTALLEEAITQMNAGKYGRSSAALKELLALDPNNMEARRLFATLHLRLGSLIPARQAFDALISEAFQRQDYWLAESLLREYLAAGPRCVPFLEKLGALYQEKGNALEAVAEYGKAIDILIEDPDPDNPHLASQLYAKIRELAPASPVAFRLASLFDAQTGELMVRRPADSEQTTVAPPLDVPEEAQRIQIGPEPMDGAMPWEIQDPPGEPDVFKATDVSDSSESPTPSTITDLPAHEEPILDEESVLPVAPLQEQITSSANEASGDVPVGEVPATRSGPELNVSEDGLPAEQERPAENEPEVYCKESDSSVALSMEVALPTEPVNDFEIPMESAAPFIGAAGLMPSSGVEEISAPVFLGTESSTAEPIETEDRQTSLQQPAEAHSEEVVTEPPPATVSSSPEPVSTDEMPEPWKQPGFSWESLFNSAWKFRGDHSANVSPMEVNQPNAEEATIAAPAPTSLQEQLSEGHVVGIPDSEASTSRGDQTSSGFPIAPMPWDQVEESVISIPSEQADQPVVESVESSEKQSAGEADLNRAPEVSDDHTPPPLSPISAAAEPETSSIVLDLEVSSELPNSIADPEPASVQTESDFKFVEPEEPIPDVSPLTMGEPPVLEAPPVAAAAPIFENRAVVDEAMASTEVMPQRAAPALSTDNDCAIPAAQSTVQELPVTPPQPIGEPLSDQTEEIPISPLLQRSQEIDELSTDITTPDLAEETIKGQTHERQLWAGGGDEARTPVPEPAPEPMHEQEKFVKTGQSIRFVEPPHASAAAQAPPWISERQEAGRSAAAAAAAVDVLFESSRNVRATEMREPVAESKPGRKSGSALIRARIAVAGFIGSCFSTTRAIVATCVGLVVLSGVLIALGIGAIGLTWVIMEESPSPAFQSLTGTPQRMLSDFKKNGYFLLLGMDAPADRDPIQAGYDRKLETHGGDSAACFGGSGSGTSERSNASAHVMRGWVRSSDPVGQFKFHRETIKEWANQHQLALTRYGQWHKLPFEDWGYGQPVGPPCATMIFAHQLHVADGFLQGVDLGVDRLETDIEVWRIVLGQARTLAVKMLALQAINDDIAVASGLLVRTDSDVKHLGRITKVLRPLDQTELSLRWPMQSELVSASKTYETRLKAVRAEEQPLYTMVASILPLPAQRRLNDYAEYYDASHKAAGEGKYNSLPKWKDYIRFPASGLMDYLTNPIENIVGLEPLPAWDLYNGFVVDTDARLRLASLQAWLRRGPSDGDLLTRIAKAGQGLYDPYTGLPMLVNLKKGVLYSVGHDGKDQDADPQSDVVVEIPAPQTPAPQTKPSAGSSKSR